MSDPLDVPAPPSDPFAGLRLGFVPGVTLTKWSRVWAERHPEEPLKAFHVEASDPLAAIEAGEADVVLARLPIEGEGLSIIPLYDERPVVVVAKEHALAALDEPTLDDLAGETRFDLDPSLDLPAAVEVVETGAGVAVMPQSLARLHTRKGVKVLALAGVPPTTIALVWPTDSTTELISDFIGVVRGRTANSSRADAPVEFEPPKKVKATAKAKAAAREKREAARASSPKKPRGPVKGRGPRKPRGR